MPQHNNQKFCIRSDKERDDSNNPLYWNNKYGWVNQSEVDIFSEEEKNIFNLPINGYWEKL